MPVPLLVTVRGKLCNVNVAVTVVAAVMVTTHGPVPEHPPPLQPVNVETGAGVGVQITAEVYSYGAEHAAPHVIPVGTLVTAPVPVPVRATVSGKLFSV